MAERISAQYITGGDPDSEDVRVAARIAQQDGLEHVVEDCSREAIASRWAQLAWRIVRENDGLVNVWQAHNLGYVPTSVNSLDTFVWGIGGEICRSFYGVPLLRWQGANPDEVLLPPLVEGPAPLARPAAQAAVVAQVRAFAREIVDEGFPVEDVLDLYFTFERLRRCVGGESPSTCRPPRSSRRFADAPTCAPPFNSMRSIAGPSRCTIRCSACSTAACTACDSNPASDGGRARMRSGTGGGVKSGPRSARASPGARGFSSGRGRRTTRATGWRLTVARPSSLPRYAER